MAPAYMAPTRQYPDRNNTQIVTRLHGGQQYSKAPCAPRKVNEGSGRCDWPRRKTGPTEVISDQTDKERRYRMQREKQSIIVNALIAFACILFIFGVWHHLIRAEIISSGSLLWFPVVAIGWGVLSLAVILLIVARSHKARRDVAPSHQESKPRH
jgi:hypothetical protein